MDNIVLIGLPTAGKSTMGVILAKTLGMQFLDTDLCIQDRTGMLLQEIINTRGQKRFLQIEEESILSLRCSHTVIATGGSVVYSDRAMMHLSLGSLIIYLAISYDVMTRRLTNITTRGVILGEGQSLWDMYHERVPLYERYADIRIDCSDMHFENIVNELVVRIHESKKCR